MSVRERVAEAGRTLARVALGRSLLLGTDACLAVAAGAWPIARTFALSPVGTFVLGLVAVASVSWWCYRRLRGPGFTVPAVSLWIEEHLPSLGYPLVTGRHDGSPASLERSIAGVDWS